MYYKFKIRQTVAVKGTSIPRPTVQTNSSIKLASHSFHEANHRKR